jgi:hypothetical protein
MKAILGLFFCLVWTTVYADLTNGLVAYYPFAGDALDASGHGLNGVVHGAAPVSDNLQRPASAYFLNGTNAYIYVGLGLPDMQAVTVAAWVQSYGGGRFFADANWEVNNDFSLDLTATNTVIRSDKPPGPVGFATNVPLSSNIAGLWKYVAWVVTTNSIQVYVDGVLSGQTANAGGVDVGYHDLVIGTTEYPQGSFGSTGYWTGAVSKLRIYDRALNGAEINQLYAQDSGPRVTLLALGSSAIVPVLENLTLGTSYQLQFSPDLVSWIYQGPVFTATNTSEVFPTYLGIEGDGFFRIRVEP